MTEVIEKAMHKTSEQLSEIKLIGITARTSNAAEVTPGLAKIGVIMQKFFGTDMQSQIPGRKSPGKVFAVYTDYESNEHGEYTYFLGEEVDDFEDAPQGFETLVIPAQNYTKFTSEPGEMPAVVINMWQDIWKMDELSLGGHRSYIADFEVYDERSHDLEHAIVDVYLGIEQ